MNRIPYFILRCTYSKCRTLTTLPQPPQVQSQWKRQRGLRLFGLYLTAGGALCLRETVWRRLVMALHPDRGGNVDTFQLVSELKRQLDAGELLTV